MLAAPYAGMLFADHGAEVIKVELPGDGDPLRYFGYHKAGVPLFWKFLARNKRAVTLDLRKPRGRELFLQLISGADVLVENFRPGTLERWDLAGETLRRAKPDLIILRVSGYGQTGPSAPKPGFGTVAEAMSGFAAINGWADRPPSLPPFAMADAVAGVTGAFGVLAALAHRTRTGEGQDVDVALYEPLLTILGSQIIDYDQLGVVQQRSGNTTPYSAPRNAYLTADGAWLALSASSQNVAARVFAAMGRSDLVADPRFASNQARLAHQQELDDIIAAWCAQRPYAEAFAAFDRAQVPVGPVYDAAGVCADGHVSARGSIATVDDPDLGPVRMQAPVPRMTGSPGRIDFAGRTVAGADNDAVFHEVLGLEPAAIAALRAEGII